MNRHSQARLILLVDSRTIEVLPLSIILLLISPAEAMPSCQRRITPQADGGQRGRLVWGGDDERRANLGHMAQRSRWMCDGMEIASNVAGMAVDMSGTGRWFDAE